MPEGQGQAGDLPDQILPEVWWDAGVSADYEASELPQCVRDGISEMQERWNNRLVWDALDIAKEYVAGRLVAVIAVDAVAGLNLDVASPVRAGMEDDVFAHGSLVGGEVDKLDPINAGSLDHGREDRVFLCVVDLAKPVEGFPSPLRVNCELDEEVDGALQGCFYSFARGFEIDPVVTGRKFQVPTPLPPVEADEFPSGVIERRSQVVDRIAQDQGEAAGQGCVGNCLEKHRAFYVTVDVNSVTVIPSEALKDRLKVTDVLIGPFNL